MTLTTKGETLKRHAQDIVENARKLRLELDAKSGVKKDYEGLSLYGMPLFTGNIVSFLVRQLFLRKGHMLLPEHASDFPCSIA